MSYTVYSTANWQVVEDGYNAEGIRFIPCAIRFEENSPEVIQQKMAASLIFLATSFADMTAFANRGGNRFLAVQTNLGRQSEFDINVPASLAQIRSNPPLGASGYITQEAGKEPVFNLVVGFNFCFLN